ncbi:MAG: translation elongation factor Ts [Solirubrobacteraceae bacterium]|jgi:elongation factor Ts
MADLAISAKDVKALRDRTGAGMMDCKKALTDSGGDVEKAIELLRIKAGKRIEDRGERVASEGTIQTYVHHNGRVGAIVEVDCETDFVARTGDFVAFAKDVASHIAAAAPRWLTEDDVPAELRDHELRIFEQEAADKPAEIREKIAAGKLAKWFSEVVLMEQVHVNSDKHEGKTIRQLQHELAAKTGENVFVRRFQRFMIGE